MLEFRQKRNYHRSSLFITLLHSNARSDWLIFYEKRNGWFLEMVQADIIAISSVEKKRLFSVKNVSLSYKNSR